MAEYKNKEDYINAVKQGIKWKKAMEAATRELSDHIDDLCDKYTEEGMEKEKAVQRAVREMGAADLVAAGLNSAYKPKTNWSLIFTVFCMLTAGVAMRAFVFPGGVPKSEIAAVFIGAAVTAALYFSDYTFFIRKARVFYWLLSGVTVINLIYGRLTGMGNAAYYTYYLLLLFPAAMAGIAFHTKTKGNFGVLFFSLYFLLPVFAAFLINSVSLLIYFSLMYLFFIAFMIKRKWAVISGATLVPALCFIIVVGSAAAYIYLTMNTSVENRTWENSVREQVFRILSGASLTGGYSGYGKAVFDGWTDNYALVYLAANYGNAAVIITLLIYAVLVFIMARIALRQRTDAGSLTAWTVVMITGFQLASGILCNFGIISARYMLTFPFLTGGGAFAVFNLFLMGIMMSVSRNEEIMGDHLTVL